MQCKSILPNKVSHIGLLIRISLQTSLGPFTEGFLGRVTPGSHSDLGGLQGVLVHELANTHLQQKNPKTVHIHLWTLPVMIACFWSCIGYTTWTYGAELGYRKLAEPKSPSLACQPSFLVLRRTLALLTSRWTIGSGREWR